MRLIDNFSLNRTSQYFRIIIIDITFQSFQILLWVSLMVIVPKHITNLLQMIWTFQTYKCFFISPPTLSYICYIIWIIFLLLIIILEVRKASTSASCFLTQIREILRNNEGQIFNPTPLVKPCGVFFGFRSFQTFNFTK